MTDRHLLDLPLEEILRRTATRSSHPGGPPGRRGKPDLSGGVCTAGQLAQDSVHGAAPPVERASDLTAAPGGGAA